MKRAILCSLALILSGSPIAAQNFNDQIRPGDILTIKVLWPSKWQNKPLASKTVIVKPDGEIAPPALQERAPADVNVGGLDLTQAGRQILQNYAPPSGSTLEVVIERGTVDQLFSK
jgi:protein involved in polysaccharide export with SLBB domain